MNTDQNWARRMLAAGSLVAAMLATSVSPANAASGTYSQGSIDSVGGNCTASTLFGWTASSSSFYERSRTYTSDPDCQRVEARLCNSPGSGCTSTATDASGTLDVTKSGAPATYYNYSGHRVYDYASSTAYWHYDPK